MPVNVHLPNPWDPDWVARVRGLLDPSVELTAGEDRPDPAAYEILVTGRPKTEYLDASPNLRAIIIPFAGVPAVTQKTMADYPHVAVHNLHHNAVPTAEMALAHLFAAAKRIVPFDRDLRKGDWGPRYTDLASFLLYGIGLITRRFEAGYYLSSVLFALTAWSIPAVMSAASGDLMGPRLASAAFGIITLFFGIGQIFGPFVAGRLADATGGYGAAFVLAAGVAALGAVLSAVFIPSSLSAPPPSASES